jgi:cell wall-associated NlpC family hydrolase
MRPKTPLTDLTSTLSVNAGTVGRRSAVIAASSGLVVTMGIPAASAAPVTEPIAPDVVPAAEPHAQPATASTVTVPADAAVNFAGTALTTFTPPPPPPPAPVVAQERGNGNRASRTTQRQSLAAPAAASVQAAPSEAGGSILAIASRYVGIMYRYGGTTPAGFDCSGFTQYVYAQAGISLPRTSGAQAAAGRRVSASEARPGDLVYTPGHVGIYAGGNLMYDSPRTGKAVDKREMWFTPTFIRVG